MTFWNGGSACAESRACGRAAGVRIDVLRCDGKASSFEAKTVSMSSLEDGSKPVTRWKDDALAGSPILVVEDERELAEEIRLELEASGYLVHLSETVDDGLRAARSGAAVLIIDRMLDGEDGLSIIEALRAKATPRPPW